MSRTTVLSARRILTMNPRQPWATHVAVRDGRILGVGDLQRLRGWGHFDLDERFADRVLMPGLVEGHCHLKEGGLWDKPYLGWFDRRGPDGRIHRGLRSLPEVIARLAEVDAQWRRAGEPDDKPLLCWGFDPIYFGSERVNARHLDQASATRRIVISHANGHLMTVNSAMLRDADITRETEVEGVIKCDNGEPHGELQEPAAMFLVVRRVGTAGLLAPMDDQGMAGFAALSVMSGVTTATDLVNRHTDSDLAILERATARDDWPVRLVPAFQAFHGTHAAPAGAEFVRSLLPRSTDRLRYGLVKMMLDGSIQGFSARLRWPGYFDGHANGIWVTAPGQYEADFEAYHRAGLTVHTHTNGDEASEVAINAMARVLARAPRPGHRHTLQHGQMIDAAQFRRMAALGVSANLFANHVWYWGEQHRALTLGPDRADRIDACRSALEAGVTLAIHSDAPVTPLGPLFTAWCAVNRLTPGGNVLGASECISVAQALHAVTLGPAWTLGLDGEIGSLEVGKRADFCVLAEDPLACDPVRLKDIAVLGTVLGGTIFEPPVPPRA